MSLEIRRRLIHPKITRAIQTLRARDYRTTTCVPAIATGVERPTLLLSFFLSFSQHRRVGRHCADVLIIRLRAVISRRLLSSWSLNRHYVFVAYSPAPVAVLRRPRNERSRDNFLSLSYAIKANASKLWPVLYVNGAANASNKNKNTLQ